jgi:hypothetical protein
LQKSSLIKLETDISQILHNSSLADLTLEESASLKQLESARASLLLSEENNWRLRSRETWLKSGDTNSRFFHKVASYNRDRKFIWSIKDSSGEILSGQRALQDEAVAHFSRLYKKSTNPDVPGMVTLASLFSKFVSEVEAAELFKPVTLSEIKNILIHFKSERSPGPDGWSTEFFCYFFDLVGLDLLQMVEDSRISGKIVGSLNSTFIVLIPKESNPLSFVTTARSPSAISSTS